jgi:hypothetical protein
MTFGQENPASKIQIPHARLPAKLCLGWLGVPRLCRELRCRRMTEERWVMVILGSRKSVTSSHHFFLDPGVPTQLT